MKRSVILAVTTLAIVVAACSTAASPSPDPATPAPSPSPALGDIVATADGAGTFTTLLAAANAAGLVETLQGEGPYTVFAPTDDAFAALPEGTLDSLLADPEALKQILLYHVVPGDVKAAEVVNLTSADSVEGSPIAIAVKDGTVYLNDTAQVIATDILASNGVIHVIDQVILPPAS
jgi:transforming growth factor-beta-induced protein